MAIDPIDSHESVACTRSAGDQAEGSVRDSEELECFDTRLAMSRSQLLVLICMCLFFMYYNYMRLYHSDFWGHVSYGTWIIENERLPQEDMYVASAKGMPLVATAWGSQVLLGLIGRLGDDELFSHMYVTVVFLSFVLLGITYRLQGGSSRPAAITCGCVMLIWLSRHQVIRPEIFALLCFCTTLFLCAVTDRRRSRETKTVDVPMSRGRLSVVCLTMLVLYAVWANLHGSFFVGFAVLGAYSASRAVDVLWGSRDAIQAFGDRILQQRIALLWSAFAGTLLNPHGIDLHIYALEFPANPNLAAVKEWFPLDMTSMEGPSMAFSWILACVVFRHSRRYVSPGDVLLLLLFSAAVCIRVRMTQWYGPVAGFVLAPHIGDCYQQLISGLEKSGKRGALTWMRHRSARTSLIGVLIVWITFCFSPASKLVLGGKPRPRAHIYSDDTPRGVTEYFRKHKPRGQVFNPQWWGDWLVWDGPEGLQVFMTTNALHVAPPSVWRDYLTISQAGSGYVHLLEKYRVNTIVICKAMQQSLHRDALDLEGWHIAYEDDISLVVARRGTLPQQSDSSDDSARTRVDKKAVESKE